MIESKPERIRIKDIAIKAGVSVGTVDRVIHGRTGVSEASKKTVEEILKQMNYQPNMYASALAYNKKYSLTCLLPLHTQDDYWMDIEAGMRHAISTYKDFNIRLSISYYDQYESGAFAEAGKKMIETLPDGVVMAPSSEEETRPTALQLKEKNIPYVFIDSNIESLDPLSFYGQNPHSSGCFAARILSLMAGRNEPVAIFRLIYDGRLGSNQQRYREKGFREYIGNNCPEMKLHELNLYVKKPEDNEKLMNEFFSAHPEVNCGITFNSKAYIIGEYMQRINRKGFKMMGYDLLRRNVKCLKAGSIDFIIAQQPTGQGQSSIESLFEHLILKKEVKPYNYMPITLISKENIDFYLDAHVRTNNI